MRGVDADDPGDAEAVGEHAVERGEGRGGLIVRGDLNPETGEISLKLGLNSKTGEKSPDRGVHAAMVAVTPRLA